LGYFNSLKLYVGFAGPTIASAVGALGITSGMATSMNRVLTTALRMDHRAPGVALHTQGRDSHGEKRRLG